MASVLAIVEQVLVLLRTIDDDRERVHRARDRAGEDVRQPVADILAIFPRLCELIDILREMSLIIAKQRKLLYLVSNCSAIDNGAVSRVSLTCQL